MERESLPFLLQQVGCDELFSLVRLIETCSDVQVIQQPSAQTMMLPIEDPVSQGLFYGGELLVSSAIVRVNGAEGWGMVLDEQLELALQIAILDGAWTAGVEIKAINGLAEKGKKIHEQAIERQGRQVAASRVSFDLM